MSIIPVRLLVLPCRIKAESLFISTGNTKKAYLTFNTIECRPQVTINNHRFDKRLRLQ
jgi:hypothetical protein